MADTNKVYDFTNLYAFPAQQYSIRKHPLTLEEWEKWKAEMAQAHYLLDASMFKLPDLSTFQNEIRRKIRELDHQSSDEEIEDWIESGVEYTERHHLGEFTDDETTDYAHAYCQFVEDNEEA